uniref:NBS-LRR disease resistance protein n=1 Tax=Dasypyrum villosum TaxID=40247 RepID=A0A8K1IB69_9POAL|nr:NBS-LRR disease resistance protein [Dasypyrum villosum]
MALRPLVAMLRDKASSYLLDKYNVMEGMEKQHMILKRRLPIILDVITDAEEQATANREGAKAWLQELKRVAYEANEVFDEFKYEALRREARKNGHYRKLGFDVIKLFPTHNRVVFRHRMGSKLCRILQDINTPVSKEWRQTDYVIIDPQEIANRSRHEDKNNIVDILLGEASNADLTVVPVKHFQLLLWVCVSDTFDVNSLAKSIVETAHKRKDDTETRDKPPPLDSLQKLVNGQRYLLVLDDVWNREVQKWERLKVSLQHGGTGSAVLTTTRDKRVAEIWEIIEARAFSSKNEKPPELLKMVGEIVKRCRGSPLAATALGSVLRTKTSVKEWKAISSRSNICTEETGVLPILKLSYNDLPPHMKQCFAFCAVFPKDYRINVEKLIRLWIANGFILEHKEDSLETIGKHIFNELASRSFFLDIRESKGFRDNYSITTCKIHDLMHDIAMSVMEKECVVATMEPSQTEWLPDTARHLFLSCRETEGILSDSMEKRSPAIQTLLCDSFMESSLQHLSNYSSLHALQICMGTELFLLKPKYLHHLRYLDLSNSSIEALPEDISILYNLQTLDLSNCSNLDRLPRQMKYMTSLRHLYTHGCRKLKSMPPELRKLSKLQTLTCFVAAVSGPNCSDVAELHYLNLGGQLELCQVENVIEAEAKVANLGNKKDLRELALRWTSVCDSKVLDNFEPCDGLQVLRIYSYGGKCMGMLQNMVEIHLFRCERLQFLFRCGTSFTFPKLKVLTLEHLLDLERWWEISERQEEQIIFPVLEKLFIKYCGKLIALPEAPLFQEPCSGGYSWVRSAFPALKKLSIQKCPKLIDLPEAPKLSVLEIKDGNQEIFHWVDRYLSLLTKLTLRLENTETTSEVECTSVVPVDSKEKWNQKSPLTVLKLGCCNSFFGSGALEPWDYFVHLEELEIGTCDVFVYWPERVFQSLVSLRRLTIEKCENLTGYAQAPLEPSASGRSRHLPGLESLSLNGCRSLVEMLNVPASLKSMQICGCDKLESIFSKQQGMSELVEGSSCIEAIVPTAVSELSSSPMNHFCPCLEYLSLIGCESLSAVLYLPPSLKTIFIGSCSSIQVLSCQLDELRKPQITTSINVPEPSAAAARKHSLPPCLESLTIGFCSGKLGILHLPTPLKKLHIYMNSGLTSLESLSAEHPPSLESLRLRSCRTLASLPNEEQAYRSLQWLQIDRCPAIKKLPTCLQQQLGSINKKELDAHLEVMESQPFKPFEPKTWKEIPRLVGERRQACCICFYGVKDVDVSQLEVRHGTC